MKPPLPTHRLVMLSLVAMGLAAAMSVALAAPGFLENLSTKVSAAAQGDDAGAPPASQAPHEDAYDDDQRTGRVDEGPLAGGDDR